MPQYATYMAREIRVMGKRGTLGRWARRRRGMGRLLHARLAFEKCFTVAAINLPTAIADWTIGEGK